MISDLIDLSREAFRLTREDTSESTNQEKFEKHFEALLKEAQFPEDLMEAVAEALDSGRQEAFKEMALTTPLYCAHCPEARRAVCIGCYDNDAQTSPACDDCCAHGCEDGFCEKLPDIMPQYEGRARGVLPRGLPPSASN